MHSTSETPVAMSYFSKAQSEYKPPLIANENAFLGDVFTSEKENPKAPISMGFYRLEKGMLAPTDLLTFTNLTMWTQAPLSYTPIPTMR